MAGQFFKDIGAAGVVTAFLHPGFHLIVYPVRSGAAYNLVAFTPGAPMAQTWSGKADASGLKAAMSRTDPALARLAEDGAPWTVWPVHTVDPMARWTVAGGIALIGDAAHAMTPFAAQGAAMAIEDAETLASHVAANPFDIALALAAWEKERRPRIARVLRRGRVNHLAWHAAGPVALARNLFLKARSPEKPRGRSRLALRLGTASIHVRFNCAGLSPPVSVAAGSTSFSPILPVIVPPKPKGPTETSRAFCHSEAVLLSAGSG